MQNGNTFENPLSPDITKDDKEFGLRFMRTAYEKWRDGVESSTARRQRYEYNRLFSSGKQPMQEYKDILDLDGELSVIQLVYEPLPIAIPFVKRLFDRFGQRQEKIQCNSIDPISKSKKEKAKDDALFKLKNKENILALQQQGAPKLEQFSDEDPTSESELEIEFGFNYKEREEVIMEQGIDLVFYDNNWDDIIKKRVLYDLFNCGIAQLRVLIDSNGRIKIRFTKPEDIISSYTEWDDFRDCQYQGEVFNMSIYDIRLQYPKFVESIGGEQKLFELAKSKLGNNGNPTSMNYDWNSIYSQSIARPYDAFKIPVIELSLKTLSNLTYESKKDKFDKDILDKAKTKNPNKEYIEQAYEVEYAGIYIIDTQYVLEWGLAKNMIKPENNLVEVKLPYITYMYDNNKMLNTPMIETMIPSIKKMQMIDLQQQKIIAAAAPDGFIVDISVMSDIDIGNGQGVLNPFQLYQVYKQTGIQYIKRLSDDGNEKRDVPIMPNNVPFSGKLEQLMNQWNSEYDKLNKITGDNDLAAGNFTNQAVGAKVLDSARNISASSSNYLYAGLINIMERTASLVMYRLWDILVHGKKQGVAYYDGYRKALGSDKIEYIKLEADDDFETTQFDVKIQAVLDDTEIANFQQNCSIVLQSDPTMLPDVEEAKRLAKTNIKYATYFLMSRYKKRRKEAMEEAAQNQKANQDSAVASAQATSQGQMELEQLKSQLKIEERKNELEFLRENELSKFLSILKVKVADKILSKDGSTVEDLPDWVMAGMGIIDKTNEMLMSEDMQDQMEEMQAKQQQQQAQAQQAQQQQMAQQQGQPQEQPQEQQPQQQPQQGQQTEKMQQQ
jgi:hypothetical protein